MFNKIRVIQPPVVVKKQETPKKIIAKESPKLVKKLTPALRKKIETAFKHKNLVMRKH